MIAGSPGPFQDERTKELAKEIYKNFVLVTNREPISTDLLKKKALMCKTQKCCMSFFLFEHNMILLLKKWKKF